MSQDKNDATVFTISTGSSEKYEWIFRVHYPLPPSEGHSQRLIMKPRPLPQTKCCKRYTMFMFQMEEEEELDLEASGSGLTHEDTKQNVEVFDLMGVVTPAYANYLM